ncbi:hypothetical protein THOM_3202 [Trachipleistophora hominis]|uniref:Uncharacterized protein n=1 Tax=Trachipleistophora hominis TaxID=72359 RepID=L7JRH6_TRAHO|nr:hypothetical protein THOM_3202 [Trachipleistophora hominis]
MNFGFMLISIFHGHGETIGCFIAGMLICGSSFLDVDLFMVPDKITNLTHISTITYILSLLPASFLLAYL